MKVSFDGLRKNIAQAYNGLARTINNIDVDEINESTQSELNETCDELRAMLGWLMLVQDEDDKDDCNDLSESVKLISTIPDGE